MKVDLSLSNWLKCSELYRNDDEEPSIKEQMEGADGLDLQIKARAPEYTDPLQRTTNVGGCGFSNGCNNNTNDCPSRDCCYSRCSSC